MRFSCICSSPVSEEWTDRTLKGRVRCKEPKKEAMPKAWYGSMGGGVWALAWVLICWGELASAAPCCDADASGQPLQSFAVSKESFRALTLLSLHKGQDHYKRAKGGHRKKVEFSRLHGVW